MLSTLHARTIPRLGWLALGVLAVAAIALGGALLSGYSIKIFVYFCLALGLWFGLFLSGNPRLLLFYALVFVSPFHVAKQFVYLGHAGGAVGFDIAITDPFLIALVAYQVRDRVLGYSPPYKFPPAMKWWVALMVLGAVEMIFDNYRLPTAHELWRMGRILVIVLVTTNEIVRRRQFVHAATAIIGAAAFQAFVGLVLYVGKFSIGLEHYGEASRQAIQDIAEQAIQGAGGIRRMSGLLTHPVLFGAYLVLTLAPGLALMFAPMRLLSKVILGAVLVLGVGDILLTLTRGAWIEFGVVLIGVLTLTFAHPQARARYFLARFVIVGGVALIVTVLSGPIINRLLHGGEASLDARIQFLHTAEKMVFARPILGFGLNNFVLDQPPYTKEGSIRGMTKAYGEVKSWPVVHSTWMLVLVEQGLVGFACFVWLHVLVLREAARNLRLRDPTLHALNVGLLCGVIAIMIDGLVSFMLRTHAAYVFWNTVALILALGYWRRANELSLPVSTGDGRITADEVEPPRRGWLPYRSVRRLTRSVERGG